LNKHGCKAPSCSAIDKEAEKEGLEEGGGAGVEAGDGEEEDGDHVVVKMEFEMVSNSQTDKYNTNNQGEVKQQIFFEKSTFPDVVDLWQNKDCGNCKTNGDCNNNGDYRVVTECARCEINIGNEKGKVIPVDPKPNWN